MKEANITIQAMSSAGSYMVRSDGPYGRTLDFVSFGPFEKWRLDRCVSKVKQRHEVAKARTTDTTVSKETK